MHGTVVYVIIEALSYRMIWSMALLQLLNHDDIQIITSKCSAKLQTCRTDGFCQQAQLIHTYRMRCCKHANDVVTHLVCIPDAPLQPCCLYCIQQLDGHMIAGEQCSSTAAATVLLSVTPLPCQLRAVIKNDKAALLLFADKTFN